MPPLALRQIITQNVFLVPILPKSICQECKQWQDSPLVMGNECMLCPLNNMVKMGYPHGDHIPWVLLWVGMILFASEKPPHDMTFVVVCATQKCFLTSGEWIVKARASLQHYSATFLTVLYIYIYIYRLYPQQKNCSSCTLDIALGHVTISIIFQFIVQP